MFKYRNYFFVFIKKIRIEIYTSVTCPHCPSARKLMEELNKEIDDLETEEFIVNTPEGNERAKQMNVKSVPMIFLQGIGKKDVFVFTGTPSKNRILEAV